MNKTIGIALALIALAAMVYAQEETEKKGVFETIFDGFAASTAAAGELAKEEFEAAREIGRESWTASRADTKERLSKGLWQGFIDEANKQAEIRRQRQNDAINLRGTREFLNARREFSNSITRYSVYGRREAEEIEKVID